MAATVHTLRPFSSAALTATGVGTWEYDVAADRYSLDPVAAAAFGFSRNEGATGLSAARLHETVDPDDIKRANFVQPVEGDMYVVDLRLSGLDRCLLVRGHLVRDAATGEVTHRRGVVVDVTVVKSEGYDGGRAAASRKAQETPLGLAVDSALAAHAAILAMGGAGRRSLMPIVELLLHELGKQTAAEDRAPPTPRPQR